MKAIEAIEESINYNNIPTIEYETEAYETLLAESEDHVEANGITEFWGIDEDGNKWRVHMNGVMR